MAVEYAAKFDIDKFKQITSDMQILYKAKGVEKQERTLVKVIKDVIPHKITDEVYEAIEVLKDKVTRPRNGKKGKLSKTKKHKRRNINGWSYHIGVWTPKLGKKIVPTANSWNKSVPGIEEFRKVLINCGLLQLVDSLVTTHFPKMAKRYKKVNSDPSAISEIFKTMAVNIDGISKPHVDGLDYDDGMCLVIPLGHYSGKLQCDNVNCSS